MVFAHCPSNRRRKKRTEAFHVGFIIYLQFDTGGAMTWIPALIVVSALITAIVFVERSVGMQRKWRNNSFEMGHPGNRSRTRRTVISTSDVL